MDLLNVLNTSEVDAHGGDRETDSEVDEHYDDVAEFSCVESFEENNSLVILRNDVSETNCCQRDERWKTNNQRSETSEKQTVVECVHVRPILENRKQDSAKCDVELELQILETPIDNQLTKMMAKTIRTGTSDLSMSSPSNSKFEESWFLLALSRSSLMLSSNPRNRFHVDSICTLHRLMCLYSQIVHSERNFPRSPMVIMAIGAPNKAKSTQASRPKGVTGTMLPYPIVAMVVAAKKRALLAVHIFSDPRSPRFLPCRCLRFLSLSATTSSLSSLLARVSYPIFRTSEYLKISDSAGGFSFDLPNVLLFKCLVQLLTVHHQLLLDVMFPVFFF